MKRQDNLRRQLMACSIVISLLLQSCTGLSNPSIATEKGQTDNTERVTNQVSISNSKKLNHREPLYQKGSQLQAIGREKLSEGNLPKHQQSGYGYVGKGSLKGVVDRGQEKEKEKKRKRKKEKNQSQTPKVKREKAGDPNQAMEIKKGAEGNRSQNLKRKREKVEERKTFKKHQKLEDSDKTNIETKKNGKNNSKIKSQREKKPTITDSLETINKRVKKKRESVNNDYIVKVGIFNLPSELLEAILSYLSFYEMMLARQINYHFYTLTTGYNKVGAVGVENKPNRLINIPTWTLKHAIDFDKLKDKLADMPSFVFYQLMREVKWLPKIYWSHLKETQLHKVVLFRDNEGATELAGFSKSLQKSNIRSLRLWFVRNGVAATQFKNLKRNNKLQESSLYNNNKLGDRGVGKWTRSLRGSNVQKFDLSDNKIGPVGAWKLGKGLRGTQVRKINLELNNIGMLGVIKLTKHLKYTNVEEINLSYSDVVHLSDVESIIKFTQNLQETKVNTIKLKNMAVDKIRKKLLSEQCPHIKWIF
ncbi:MAG: hypothetical protein ACYC2U_02815 [Candidatus Amoebophilus sp.]